jgi:hypothetical protein
MTQVGPTVALSISRVGGPGAVASDETGSFDISGVSTSNTLYLRFQWLPTGGYMSVDNASITVSQSGTPYDAWSNGTFANAFTDKVPTHDPDGDGLTNQQEYAFGMDPTLSTTTGIVFLSDGAVTTAGVPVAANFALGEGVDYRAVLGRRKDHVAAGLTYTVQFSVDVAAWTDSTDTPTVLTGDGAANPSEIEAVSVPYPLFIPYTRDGIAGFEKPTFFRVAVSSN